MKANLILRVIFKWIDKIIAYDIIYIRAMLSIRNDDGTLGYIEGELGALTADDGTMTAYISVRTSFGSGNCIYFINNENIYQYDCDKDTLEVVYTYLRIGKSYKIFDVIVYRKAASPEKKYDFINDFFVYDGKLYLCLNGGIVEVDKSGEKYVLGGQYICVSDVTDGKIELERIKNDERIRVIFDIKRKKIYDK